MCPGSGTCNPTVMTAATAALLLTSAAVNSLNRAHPFEQPASRVRSPVSRASFILVDDCETPTTAMTQVQREAQKFSMNWRQSSSLATTATSFI